MRVKSVCDGCGENKIIYYINDRKTLCNACYFIEQ